jgi:hypothetical protein
VLRGAAAAVEDDHLIGLQRVVVADAWIGIGELQKSVQQSAISLQLQPLRLIADC